MSISEEEYARRPDYMALPECMKNDAQNSNPNGYTAKEYAFLPAPLKSTIIEDETTPETFYD